MIILKSILKKVEGGYMGLYLAENKDYLWVT
jgi:hypothetical protein